MSPLDTAYWERNQLVLALTKIWPSYIGIDPEAESPEWSQVIYVRSPVGQLSWHIHADEINKYFSHIKGNAVVDVWDGHTTEEKYERLRGL